MNLHKENPRKIATLIVKGNLELGEVPSVRRPLVQAEIDDLTKPASKPKPKPKPKPAPATEG